MEIQTLGLNFKNPVILASGPWGFGEGYKRILDFNLLGGITFKSITLKPRKGNPYPRLLPLEYGMLNSIGLQNPGLDTFRREILPSFEEYDTVRICSVAGHDPDEYLIILDELEDESSIDAFELNLSCPNVEGEPFCYNKEAIKYIVSNAKRISSKPLIAKFSVEGNILPFVEQALNSGIDALNIGNSPVGLAIDIEQMKPYFRRILAGYSGKGVKPIVLKQVYTVFRHFKPTIIALGGIYTYKDALEYIMAGASLVSVGSAIYTDPRIPMKIVEGMKAWLEERGISDLSELVGVAVQFD